MIDLILLCAGKSERFGQRNKPLTEFYVNKLYQPIWWITYNKFKTPLKMKKINKVFVTIPKKKDVFKWVESIPQTYLPSELSFVAGDITRNLSLLKALRESKADYVIIHDGVRPFVSEKTINKCIKAVNDGLEPAFFCKKADYTGVVDTEIVDRSRLHKVITPMVFNRDELITALTKDVFGDPSLVYQDQISNAYFFEEAQEFEDFKLTYPHDKIIFQALFDNGVR